MVYKKRKNIVVIAFLVVLFGVITNAVSSDFMWGNLVMDRTMEQMQKAKVNPVVYPHWLHRTWFRCKVCHLDIVKPKKGSNNIDMKKIEEGKVCGACHNGKLAFGVKDNCKRCHSLTPDGKVEGPIYSPDNIPDDEFKKIAQKFGASWNPEAMGKDGLPRDRFGFIDWIKMIDMGVVKPTHSLNPEDKDVIKDSAILFHVLSDFEDDVLFSHKVHTYWMECKMCHDSLFKAEAGGNRIRMKDMVISQNFCIHCHGKVSFPAASCTNCHRWEKEQPVVKKGEDNIIDRHEKKDAVIVNNDW